MTPARSPIRDLWCFTLGIGIGSLLPVAAFGVYVWRKEARR